MKHGTKGSRGLHTSTKIHETSDIVPKMPDKASLAVNGATSVAEEESEPKKRAGYMALLM